MSPTTIREYYPGENDEHLELVVRAYLDLFNDPDNLRYVNAALKPLGGDYLREVIGESNSEDSRYFGCLDEAGSILALVVVEMNPDEGFLVVGLGVRPDSRNQGIGAALTTHALHVARELGFYAVDFDVFADNTQQLRLLLGLGFIPIRMTYGVRADGGNLIRMRRDVRGLSD